MPFLVLDGGGAAVTSGTILPSVLPVAYTTVEITVGEYNDFRQGLVEWSGEALVETVRATREFNRAAIEITVNEARSDNATYLAIETPTAAEKDAQIHALTQQVNALARLVLNQFDDVT